MASQGVPSGKKVSMVDAGGGMVNKFPDQTTNEMKIPYGQTPGFQKGNKEVSMNQMPSTARVVKPATSNLMTGMSQNRGTGGNK